MMMNIKFKSGFGLLGLVRPMSKPLFLSRPSVYEACVAFISGKALRSEDYVRAAPWPYMEKSYNNFHALIDGTTKRFDENTKVIFVEGMPALGKTKFAKTLAEDLDMKHFPMVNLDMLYMTPYGDDLRALDPQVPKSMRSYDEKHFFRDPKNPKSLRLQIYELFLKTHMYFDALAHLFNTGQGVVIERSPYSDFVFAEAMYACGYFDKHSYNAYNKHYSNALEILMKPHLVIYLDAPNTVVTQNLKSRGQGEENALTPEFLDCLEEKYKFNFLKSIEEHAEILIYDWSEPGDVEVVVEDIERIDFDKYEDDPLHPKMKDWRFRHEVNANERRWEFTHQKYRQIIPAFLVLALDCPVLFANPDERKVFDDLVEQLPGMQYSYGFNPSVGDSVLFKTKNRQLFEPMLKQNN